MVMPVIMVVIVIAVRPMHVSVLVTVMPVIVIAVGPVHMAVIVRMAMAVNVIDAAVRLRRGALVRRALGIGHDLDLGKLVLPLPSMASPSPKTAVVESPAKPACAALHRVAAAPRLA